MGDQMNRYCKLRLLITAATVSLISLTTSTVHSTDLRALGTGFWQSTDSEAFVSRRTSLDGIAHYQHLDNKVGARYTQYDFSKPGWSRQAQQLKIVANRFDRQTLDGWSIESGVFQTADKSLITLDATLRQTLAPGRTIEWFANRDLIETATAIENGTYFNFAGVSADFQVNPQWTLVGLAGYQQFSDDNQRRHARGRLIFQPWLDTGLTAQLRYRYFDSSLDNVGGAYFNPTRYQETMLALGWRKRIGNWRHAATAGIGQQVIGANAATTTHLLEASSERQGTGWALRLRGGYSDAASLASSDPNYWYRYLSLDLAIPF